MIINLFLALRWVSFKYEWKPMETNPQITFLEGLRGLCMLARQRGDVSVARLAIEEEERLLQRIAEVKSALALQTLEEVAA
jgi:hypothetical protein